MATIYFFMMKMIIFIYILLGWCYSNYGPLERENTEHSHVFACSFTPLLPKTGKKNKTSRGVSFMKFCVFFLFFFLRCFDDYWRL